MTGCRKCKHFKETKVDEFNILVTNMPDSKTWGECLNGELNSRVCAE